MNPLKRITSVFNRTPKQTNNSISTDFLRRGNRRAKQDIVFDKKINPELEINGWMWASLNLRADSFAEFCEENIITENDTDIDMYHPYLDLIENSKTASEFSFWRDLVSDYDIYGQAFIFLLRRVVYEEVKDVELGTTKRISHIGLPVAIEVLDAKNVTILKNGKNEVVGYSEKIDSTHKREFLAEQVVHIMNHHPKDRKKPYSLFEACKDYQYTINKSTEFAQNALINNINTPGILSTEEVLTDAEYDNLISRINSHEPGKAIVTDGTGKLSYLPITQQIDSTALPSLTEISRQTIFAVTGTSKTILGIEESGVTRETSKVQDKKFIKRTIAPVAKKVISALNFDYRIRYEDLYLQNKIRMSIKPTYDPQEVQEQFATQKMLFDDITEIVYSGYTKESAEDFMYGDISFTDLELEEEENAEDMAEDMEEPETLEVDAGDTSLDSPETSGETEEEKVIEQPSEEQQNEELPIPSVGPIEEKVEKEEKVELPKVEELSKTDVLLKKVTPTKADKLKVKIQDQHNHEHGEIPDDYYKKALGMHMNELGELDEYGKHLESQIIRAQNSLLTEIRKIQLDAIKMSNSNLVVNSFDYEDIRTEEQHQSIFNRLYRALRKYWMFILPIIGKERLSEDEFTTGKKQTINLLGTKKVQDFIKESSSKAAESHTNTIFKTILDAANKAQNKVFEKKFAEDYIEEYKKQPQLQWFKKTPTPAQVVKKLKDEAFVKQNNPLYLEVQKKIAEGLGRGEIQKEIRKQYVNLSKQRADMLVRNEMARSVNNSQFIADYEFLKKINMLDRAYKKLVSNSGDPCPICQALIDEGEIPFMQPFMSLGDSIQVNDGDKTTIFTCNYENIDSGVVHPSCRCRYELIIRES